MKEINKKTYRGHPIRVSDATFDRLKEFKGMLTFNDAVNYLLNTEMAFQEQSINLKQYHKRMEKNIKELKSHIINIRITPNQVISDELKDTWIDNQMSRSL